MKGLSLNRKMRSSNLQQNKTKTGNSRIPLKLPQNLIRMQKPPLKGESWSKTILLWANQLRRTVVSRQDWDGDYPSVRNAKCGSKEVRGEGD